MPVSNTLGSSDAVRAYLYQPLNEERARSLKAIVAKLQPGFFSKISELRANADLPSCILEGRIAHTTDYIELILEAATDVENSARAFADMFLKKDAAYSNTDTGLAAIQLESYLWEHDSDLWTKFIETQIEARQDTYLAIFRGKLHKEERERLAESVKKFTTFKVLVNGGDVEHTEGVISDVCILECVPVKEGITPAPTKKEKVPYKPKMKDRDSEGWPKLHLESLQPKTEEDYAKVRIAGGIDRCAFGRIMGDDIVNAAMLRGATVSTTDNKGTVWTLGEEQKWIPADTVSLEDDDLDEQGNIEALIKYWKKELADKEHPWDYLHKWALKHPKDITGDPKAWAAWMHKKVFGVTPIERKKAKEAGEVAKLMKLAASEEDVDTMSLDEGKWLTRSRLKKLLSYNVKKLPTTKLVKLQSDLRTFYWMYKNEDYKSMAQGDFLVKVVDQSASADSFTPKSPELYTNLLHVMGVVTAEVKRRQKNENADTASLLDRGVDIDSIDEGVEEDEKLTAAIAKAFQKHKKKAGIKSIKQNYKGTGTKKADRQLWVHFANGAVIDIWIYKDHVTYGGVVYLRADGKRVGPNPAGFAYGSLDATRVGMKIADDLKTWAEGEQAPPPTGGRTEDLDETIKGRGRGRDQGAQIWNDLFTSDNITGGTYGALLAMGSKKKGSMGSAHGIYVDAPVMSKPEAIEKIFKDAGYRKEGNYYTHPKAYFDATVTGKQPHVQVMFRPAEKKYFTYSNKQWKVVESVETLDEGKVTFDVFNQQTKQMEKQEGYKIGNSMAVIGSQQYGWVILHLPTKSVLGVNKTNVTAVKKLAKALDKKYGKKLDSKSSAAITKLPGLKDAIFGFNKDGSLPESEGDPLHLFSLNESAEFLTQSEYGSWYLMDIEEKTQVWVDGKYYIIEATLDEVQQLLGKMEEFYPDLPDEKDMMIEAFLKEYCEVEGALCQADTVSPIAESIGGTPSRDEFIAERNATVLTNANLRLLTMPEATTDKATDIVSLVGVAKKCESAESFIENLNHYVGTYGTDETSPTLDFVRSLLETSKASQFYQDVQEGKDVEEMYGAGMGARTGMTPKMHRRKKDNKKKKRMTGRFESK